MSGRCPGWSGWYLVAGDALADDFGVFVDPDVGCGGSGEEVLDYFAEHE